MAGSTGKSGGVFFTTQPTLLNGQRTDTQMTSFGATLVMVQTRAGQEFNITTPAADGGSVSAGLWTNCQPFVFNGSTWDRARGDTNGAVVQSGLSATFWGHAGATAGIVNTTTAVTIKTAAGASVRNYLKTLTIDHDTLGAGTELAIRDGAAGTVLWRGKLLVTAKEGTAIHFDPPLKGTANTLMEIVTLTAVTGGVFVNATGFTGA